jgi:pyruvate/2-oxoglutarate dehydrogenase complex dihydrolipoamide dehydrogenase (E3) component
VYAIGDVIGPPGLASAAQNQARKLIDHLFSGGRDDINKAETLSEAIEMTDVDDGIVGDDPFFMSVDNEVSSEIATKSKSKHDIFADGVPLTLWTIPEIAAVGLTAVDAEKKYNSKGLASMFMSLRLC